MKGYIYYLKCGVNDKHYVGQTTNPKRRKAYHFTPSIYRFNNNPIYTDINLYGKSNFIFEVVAEIEIDDVIQFKAEMLRQEVEFIKKFDSITNGYNLELGNAITEEVKKRLSDSRKEYFKTHDSYWKGKSLSEECKKKISEKKKGCIAHNKGKKMSEEFCSKLRGKRPQITGELNGFYGKKHTAESLKLMSQNRKGLLTGKDNAGAVQVRNIDTGLIFDTMTDASVFYGIHAGNISSVCSGKLKTTGGFHWEYVNKHNKGELT